MRRTSRTSHSGKQGPLPSLLQTLKSHAVEPCGRGNCRCLIRFLTLEYAINLVRGHDPRLGQRAEPGVLLRGLFDDLEEMIAPPQMARAIRRSAHGELRLVEHRLVDPADLSIVQRLAARVTVVELVRELLDLEEAR